MDTPPVPQERRAAVAAEAGGVLLVIDAESERAAAWYAAYGAAALADSPLMLVLPLRTMEALLQETGKI